MINNISISWTRSYWYNPNLSFSLQFFRLIKFVLCDCLSFVFLLAFKSTLLEDSWQFSVWWKLIGGIVSECTTCAGLSSWQVFCCLKSIKEQTVFVSYRSLMNYVFQFYSSLLSKNYICDTEIADMTAFCLFCLSSSVSHLYAPLLHNSLMELWCILLPRWTSEKEAPS